MSRKMLSVVVVLRNAEADVEQLLAELDHATRSACGGLDLDHEILLVDNGSTDATFERCAGLLQVVPDARILALVSNGDPDPAFLAGMELALGDWVLLFDPLEDDLATLPVMVAAVVAGADVALPRPGERHGPGLTYGLLSGGFVAAFRMACGIDLRAHAGRYRVMSRRVVAWLTAQENANLAYRTLPLLGGFRTVLVDPAPVALPRPIRARTLRRGLRQALDLVTATSVAPLRLATLSCALAAGCSLAYSVYVAMTYMMRDEVAPGWTTLSLQIGAMFFLLSMALALLSEYVLQMAGAASRRLPYHLVREARSAVISRESRFNVVGLPERGTAAKLPPPNLSLP